jgi:hypothetical protein
MNRVEIAVRAPIMENLAEITISDDHDKDVFTIDNADVESARAEGTVDLLELVLENASQRGIDIVAAARMNGSPVHMDGADVDQRQIHDAFEVRAKVAP